jgi:ABC-type sugar transport system ATPase subunit
LLPITSGEIAIGDRVVNDIDPKDRNIAMVFQNYALYPQKSVYKNLAFPLQMRRLPRDEIDRKVREAARVLDMTHLLERKPRELSGLIPLEASTVDGRTVLTSAEGWTMTLSPLNARKVEQSTTKKVVLGARHSTIKLAKGAAPNAIPARAYTVEPTGDVTFVQALLSGAVVNISVPPNVAIAPDEQIWLEFDQERMHLFDGGTELALKAG